MLLYAPGADAYLEELVKNADRVFYFDEGPRAEAKVVAIRSTCPSVNMEVSQAIE